MSWISRFKPQPASLSSKVLWCTVASILLIEILAMIPVLGQQRKHWMDDTARRADITASALQASPAADASRLLQLAGIQHLTLIYSRRQTQSWQIPSFKPGTFPLVVPGDASIAQDAWSACRRIIGYAPAEETIKFSSTAFPGETMAVVLDTAPLTAMLRTYVRIALGMIVILALLSGLLVYTVLNWLLVRPMEVLTAAIIRFREAPEEANISGLDWLAARPKDDISSAALELKYMQEELRAALWRNARLAAVGTAVAKIAHDLRNILTSALLVADRLQDVDDPVVRRAAGTLIPSVERAAHLVSRTVDFAREGRMPVNRTAVCIRALIDDVIQTLAPEGAPWTIENRVPLSLVLPLDRDHLYRVFTNLIRNATEAGATRVRLSTQNYDGQTWLSVADNGPGLPERARINLFKPFAGAARNGGTGLGLTIARDLIRAHGGDLVLNHTGHDGTIFSMLLSVQEVHDRMATVA
ncbi:HAMP domain-containing sensor histidine kinase [Acidocella sp.]|uniref:sensor histidine kinase n=1 Tax=Acidocella sp. TaxID=50710 RepID=UPI00261DA114|nr:HAMP domain-containing sensor histidine kinase [Acidocella sp.]